MAKFNDDEGQTHQLGFNLVGSGFGIYLGDPITLAGISPNDIFIFGRVVDEKSIQTLALLRRAFGNVDNSSNSSEAIETVVDNVAAPQALNSRNPANVDCFKTNGHITCEDSIYRFGNIPIHGGVQIKTISGKSTARSGSEIENLKNIKGTSCCRPLVTTEVAENPQEMLRTFQQRLVQWRQNLAVAYRDFSGFKSELFGALETDPTKTASEQVEDLASGRAENVGKIGSAKGPTAKPNSPYATTNQVDTEKGSMITRRKLVEYRVLTEKHYERNNISNPSHYQRLREVLDVLLQVKPGSIPNENIAALKQALFFTGETVRLFAEFDAAHAKAFQWFDFGGHAKEWPTFEEMGGHDGHTVVNQPVSEVFLTIGSRLGSSSGAITANQGMYQAVADMVLSKKLVILSENRVAASGRGGTASLNYSIRHGLSNWFTTKEYRQALQLLVPNKTIPLITDGLTTLFTNNPFAKVYSLPTFKTKEEAFAAFKPVYEYLKDPAVHQTLFFAFDDMRIEASASGRQDPFVVNYPQFRGKGQAPPPPKMPDIGASRRWREAQINSALRAELEMIKKIDSATQGILGSLVALEGALKPTSN